MSGLKRGVVFGLAVFVFGSTALWLGFVLWNQVYEPRGSTYPDANIRFVIKSSDGRRLVAAVMKFATDRGFEAIEDLNDMPPTGDKITVQMNYVRRDGMELDFSSFKLGEFSIAIYDRRRTDGWQVLKRDLLRMINRDFNPE